MSSKPLPNIRPRERHAHPPPTRDEALLSQAGPLVAANVLIIGQSAVDLLCALLRRGCPAATCLKPEARPDAQAYSLTIVPDVTNLPAAEDALRSASRVLAAPGRIVIGIPTTAPKSLPLALSRRLRLNGFRTVATIAYGDRTVLSAQRPRRQQ
ncbi:MAG TPA: hypothetical protein VFG62_22070 [Rhodopila sp.]|jgi:hypothetical protein|nr:hypothetical protein [Rhodopila sp.]